VDWIGLPVLTALAFVATSVAVDPDGLDLLQPVVDALRTGRPVLAAALMLVVAAALVRRYGSARFPVLNSELGSAATVLVGSFGAAAASAMTGGSEPSWGLAWQALVVAVGASGGYSLLKQLVVDPLLRPLARKAPAWARPVIEVFLWPFTHVPKKDRIEAAVIAGEIAAQKTPPQGLRKVTGKPRDVD
jgi:hypothetical protein